MRLGRRRKKKLEGITEEILEDMQEAIPQEQRTDGVVDVKKVKRLLKEYQDAIAREMEALEDRAGAGDLPVVSVSFRALMNAKLNDIDAAIQWLEKYDWVGVDG